MDYLAEIAKGGFGYLLFVGALFVVFRQNSEIKELNDKRIVDALQYKEAFVGTAKDLLNAQQNLQRSIDNIIDFLDRIKWKEQ